MKFLHLVWAGVWRRPARSVLTALSIAVAFLLLGLLEGVSAGFEKAIAESQRDILITDRRMRGGAKMPISSLEKIRAMPGVREATLRDYFTGTVGGDDPRSTTAAIATEPEIWLRLRPAFAVSKDHLNAMSADRAGLLATPPLLKQFGWKIGDTVTLRSRTLKLDGTGDWTFHVVGTFDTKTEPTSAAFGLMHYSYLNDSRATERDRAEQFSLRIADPTKAMSMAAAIDRIFANSPHETRTRSGEQRAEARAKQLGDIAFFTNTIMGAVLFTLVFLTANTLRQSLQERTSEFGVLKSMGFADMHIFTIALSEALLLCLPPAALGLLLARLVAPLAKGDFGAVVVSPGVALFGLTSAVVLALVSVALPAWTAARLPIAVSLGRR
jgi:putative ABC transport system permease protein